jgi:hypothetical protein
MRKALLFVFALLFATVAMAQNRTTYLEESFDGNTIPEGWTKVGAGTSNWTIKTTNNAGGEANELHLNWSPQFNGIARFVSPVIDLSGLSSVVISFKHFLDYYNNGAMLGIATTSDGGSTWHQAWSQTFTTDALGTITQEITTSDVGSANFQFCIFYSGSSYNFDNWYFDDIKVFTLENLDIAVTGTNMPDITLIGDLTVSLGVMNYGATPVTSIEASYEVEGMEPVSQTFDVNIASLANTTLNFTQPIALSTPGAYPITLRVLLVNGEEDNIAENNMCAKTVSVPLDAVQRIPMIEHFSSSTCGPCVSVNNTMNTFCNNNAGRFTYTKYQMNWPGNGDPYYTAEGGIRRTYYGVSAVPDIYLDGEGTNNSAVSQNTFNQHANEPGYFDVRGSFNVEGNVISIKADIMPYVSTEARVYVAVNEKVTTGNVGGNGETSFHHVFMKMMPDGNGSTIAFNASELQHLEFTQDLSSTHVEEMSDLEVSIWVQNHGSRYVYNSHFAYEYTDLYPYAVENLVLTDNTAQGGTMVATWEAPAEGNPIGYNVYLNGEAVLEGTNDLEYSFTAEPDVFYVVGVEALYDGQSSVRVVAVVSENLQDLGLITEEHSFVLNEETMSAELNVTNANHNTQADINILSIEEINSEEVQYLTITAEELPYVLPYGEGFTFVIEPNYLGEEKSMAHTTLIVTSDAGTLEFEVEIDGEVLSVTEVSAKAKIYPNPANTSVCIEAENGIESVNVYNVLGVLVETIPANAKSVNVNLSNYSNGIYFFNIRQSDGTVSNQRVMVCH